MTLTRKVPETSGRAVRLLVLAGFLASLLTVLPLPQVAVPRAAAAADIGVRQAIRGLGQAAVDDHAAGQAGADVGCAHAEELGVGVDVDPSLAA